MIRKLILIAAAIALVFVQAYFVFSVQFGGDQFTAVWHGFGVNQTAYSQFVFRTIRWWWCLPALCLGLVLFAVSRQRALYAVAATVASLLGALALYGSAYSPDLLIRLP